MNKEFVHLTANQRLMELLASINHNIAYKLVESVKYKWNSPISFLDFGENNDTVSFVNSSKVWELMDKYGDDYKVQAWVSNRSDIKIGKAVKLIFGNAFPINHPKGTPEIKPKIDIESFVNMFKAERDKNKNYERFELVKGTAIKYWYNQKNYSRFIQEDTTLAKSCLRYEEYGKFLQMYVDNPHLVNMLILKDDVERLRARALVWYLTYPEGRIYMERIYTINDADVELYKKYAREQGWLYKSRQTYGYHHNIVDGKTGEEYNWENFVMKVQLKHKSTKYHPYLDTLCVYNPETGIISNEGKLLRRPPYIKLADSQGGFIDESDHREMVFSRHYNDEIPREEAHFISLDQDWVFAQDVVYIHNSGGKNSHRNSELVCESKIFGNIKYFIKEQCVWSEHLSTFIYKDSSREAYIDKKKTEKVIIHRRMVGKFFEVDKDGDIIKKKVDASMPFEDFLAKRGMSMKSRRKDVEKVYNEWNYNRTIHWDELVDDNDTEEITPHSRRRDSSWADHYMPSPTRRRRHDNPIEDERMVEELDISEPDAPRPIVHDVTTPIADDLFVQLTRLSAIPHGRFGIPTPMPPNPNQEEQLLGRSNRPQPRIVRPDEPIELRRESNGPTGPDGIIELDALGEPNPERNTARFRIRPTQRVGNETIERGEPNTSAHQDNPNDTSNQVVDWGEIINGPIVDIPQSHRYNWNFPNASFAPIILNVDNWDVYNPYNPNESNENDENNDEQAEGNQ